MILAVLLATAAAQLTTRADPVFVSRAGAAEAKLRGARYAWHECVTIAAMNEVAAGLGRGSMSLATQYCQSEEDAVQETLNASLTIDDDFGFAAQQMEEWRKYEIRWAQKMLELGGGVPLPKTFKFRR